MKRNLVHGVGGSMAGWPYARSIHTAVPSSYGCRSSGRLFLGHGRGFHQDVRQRFRVLTDRVGAIENLFAA
jgi:hypothetical protein